MSRRAVAYELNLPTHGMHTPYKGGQGSCILYAIDGGRKMAEDDTERLTSRKLI